MRIKIVIMVAVALTAAAGCATGPTKSCWPVACPTDTSTGDGGAAGRGPKDNRPPNRPDGPTPPAVADGSFTFVGEVLDDTGTPVTTVETGRITVGAIDDDMQPVSAWVNEDTGRPEPVVDRVTQFPVWFHVDPLPTVHIYSFTAEAILPANWSVKCTVVAGDVRSNPGLLVAAVISSHVGLKSTGSSMPATASCTYPGI